MIHSENSFHMYIYMCVWRERECFYKINVDEIGTNLAAIWTVVNTCSRNWKIKLFCFLWFCSLNSHYIAHSIVIQVLILAIIFLQWQFVIYSCDELLCSNCIRKTSRDWQMKRDFDDFMFAYYVCYEKVQLLCNIKHFKQLFCLISWNSVINGQ